MARIQLSIRIYLYYQYLAIKFEVSNFAAQAVGKSIVLLFVAFLLLNNILSNNTTSRSRVSTLRGLIAQVKWAYYGL